MAETDDQEKPKPANPRNAKCKAGGEGGSRGQHVTQLLQAICHARRNRSGNQTDDRAQSQHKPDLLCGLGLMSKPSA